MATLAEISGVMKGAIDGTSAEAVALLGKIEAALWIKANQIGTGELPGLPGETTIARTELNGLAKLIARDSASVARTTMRILLAKAALQNPAITVAQIVAATDTAVLDFVGAALPLIAKGMHPERV